MKSLLSILLLVLITIHLNASLLVWGAYSLFQKQIAEKYCEVYFEDRLCNGQCFVRKIIIKTEQQEQKQTSPQIRISELSPAITEDILVPSNSVTMKKQLRSPFLASTLLSGFLPSVFHPPTV